MRPAYFLHREGYRMLTPVQRYIQDVSKAMAAEVRQLMQEVGSLRDERQKLQRCVPLP